MSERDLQALLQKLKSSNSYPETTSLLSKAKLTLLKLSCLTPSESTSPSLLVLARDVFSTGALLSIRSKDPDSFTRYVHQLLPFWELPSSRFPSGSGDGERNKITGLYLLLLLTQGDYAGFHTELEGLELRAGDAGIAAVEGDRYLGYPIKLERWLMEGSYDLVWKEMNGGEVPSEEYSVFTEVLSPFSSSFPSQSPITQSVNHN
jgi:26S proteasome regulatory subunit N12